MTLAPGWRGLWLHGRALEGFPEKVANVGLGQEVRKGTHDKVVLAEPSLIFVGRSNIIYYLKILD